MNENTVTNIITGLIRTVVPALMGQLIAWLTTIGITVDQAVVDNFNTMAITLLGVILTGAYYLLVRVLAKKYPKLELLLGSEKKPDYTK